MEYIPAAVAVLVLGGLLWLKGKQLDNVIRLFEVALAAAAKDRATLVAQVQAPEQSPVLAMPEGEGETLHVPFDDDEAWAEYLEARAEGEVA